jgi:hypothetical protein
MSRDANAELIIDTKHFLALAQIKRHQLQTLERLDVVHPVEPGRVGRGGGARWTFMQAVAVEYYRAFTAAGMHSTWAVLAAKWVQRQSARELAKQLKAGKTLLSLTPDGDGHLVEPRPKSTMSREQRIKLAQLNLGWVLVRVLRRDVEVVRRMVDEIDWSLDEIDEELKKHESQQDVQEK